MKPEQALINLITTVSNRVIPTTITVGKVKEVRGNVCDVEREDLPEILDVRLNAIEIEEELKQSFTIIPQLNSYVVIGFLDKTNSEAVVLQCSEIERVEIKFNDNFFTINNDGISMSLSTGKFDIKNQNENLKTILSELLDAITQITVTTGTGPSGIPINAANFTDLKTRLNNIFN